MSLVVDIQSSQQSDKCSQDAHRQAFNREWDLGGFVDLFQLTRACRDKSQVKLNTEKAEHCLWIYSVNSLKL